MIIMLKCRWIYKSNNHLSKANLSDVNDAHIYLAVKMSKKGAKKLGYALIPLPVGITGRFIKLPDIGNNHYVIYLDDIVRYHLHIYLKVWDMIHSMRMHLSSLRMLRWKLSLIQRKVFFNPLLKL